MLNRGGGKYYKHLTRLSSLVLFIFAYAIVITGSTYAFMSFSAMSDSVANGQGGCFNVSYTGEELNAGNILSTTNYLEGAHTTVTLSKDSTCKIYTEANIYVHTNDTTTAPIDTIHALKYKLFMEGNQISEGLITQIGDTLIATVPLTDIATTYTIYLWIDPEMSNGAYHDTSYSGYIYADSSQTSTIEGKYLVSFDRGNLLYGLEDTNGEVAARGSTTNPNSYIDYSINDDSITVTNNGTQDDGYGLIEPIKINLEKGKTYIFNCDTDGTIGATGNTDTIEILFGLDGKWITWIRMNSTTNYEFTPTTTGTYWLRLDVNQKGKTHTFSNISITEKESSMFTKTVTAGQEYGWLPTFEKDGYKLTNWSLNGNSIKSSTIVSENNNHTLTARWGEPYELTNLVTNGSFEHGRADWNNWFSNIDDIIVSSEVSKFGRYSIKNYGTTKWQTINNPFTGVSNHHYYYSSYAYSKTTNCYSTFGYYYDNSFHWPNSSRQTVLNVWERQSGVEIGPNTDYQVYYNVADSSSDNGVARECYADGVVVIDLTESFGSGNEPSKVWCDENIDYFDGITTVYK